MTEINCAEIVTKYFYIILALIFVLFAVAVMIFKYFLKWSKDGVELKQADKRHDLKQSHSEERIKKLEEKNGHELQRIEELNSEIKELKQFISKNITKDRIN